MSELLNSIGTNIKDRVSSPLFGSFALSWLILNYKFVLVLFADMPVDTKFNYIESNIAIGDYYWWLHGGLYPSLVAAVYLFLYPFPSTWVHNWWEKYKSKLRDQTTHVTIEVHKELEDEYASLKNVKDEFKKEVDDGNTMIAKLKTEKNILQEDKEKLLKVEKENYKLHEIVKSNEKRIEELNKVIGEKNNEINILNSQLESAPDLVRHNNVYENNIEITTVVFNILDFLNERQEEVPYLEIMDTLNELYDYTYELTRHVLIDILEKDGFVKRVVKADADFWLLTEKGKRYLENLIVSDEKTHDEINSSESDDILSDKELELVKFLVKADDDSFLKNSSTGMIYYDKIKRNVDYEDFEFKYLIDELQAKRFVNVDHHYNVKVNPLSRKYLIENDLI